MFSTTTQIHPAHTCPAPEASTLPTTRDRWDVSLSKLFALDTTLEQLGFVGRDAIASVRNAIHTLRDAGEYSFRSVLATIPHADMHPLLAAGILVQLANAHNKVKVGEYPDRTPILFDVTKADSSQRIPAAVSSLLYLALTTTTSHDFDDLRRRIIETPDREAIVSGAARTASARIQDICKKGGINPTIRNVAIVSELNALLFQPEKGEAYPRYTLGAQLVSFDWAERLRASNVLTSCEAPPIMGSSTFLRLVGTVIATGENTPVNYHLDYVNPFGNRVTRTGKLPVGETEGSLAFGTVAQDAFLTDSEDALIDALTTISARQNEVDDRLCRQFADQDLALRQYLATSISPKLNKDVNSLKKLKFHLDQLDETTTSMGSSLRINLTRGIRVSAPAEMPAEFRTRMEAELGITFVDTDSTYRPPLTIRSSQALMTETGSEEARSDQFLFSDFTDYRMLRAEVFAGIVCYEYSGYQPLIRD